MSNASGTKQQSVNYYPYGMQFGDASGSDVQPYKYSGKEYDGMHGMNLYDSEARYYDPATGRFTTMYPLAEKYYGWSPYAYCLNNPLRIIDPRGKDGWDVVFGYSIGLLTNIIPGPGFIRDTYSPTDNMDYNNALQGVDNAAIALGIGMIDAGGTGTVVGGILAVAGVSVTVGSGGVAAVAGGPTAVLGGTLAGASAATLGSGMVLMSSGNQNKDAGYERGRSGSTIVNKGGVKIKSYRTGDAHKPAYGHVTGGGKDVRIGPNGKPLKGEPELSPKQHFIVQEYIKSIRKEINKVGKENKKIEDYERGNH